jgi:hypothetical protein
MPPSGPWRSISRREASRQESSEKFLRIVERQEFEVEEVCRVTDDSRRN